MLSGRFRAFDSRRERIVPDMILASAAIPNVFPTVHVDGGAFWDGLFSRTPGAGAARPAAGRDLGDPDQPDGPGREPKTVLEIADRRNELSGNLSLYQELHHIEVIDRLLAEGLLVGDQYKHVTVRILEFARPLSSKRLGPASKLNRDAGSSVS